MYNLLWLLIENISFSLIFYPKYYYSNINISFEEDLHSALFAIR